MGKVGGRKEEKESGTDSGKELSGPERKVWENLDVYAKGINRLCDETGLSLLECMSAVMKLQMKKKQKYYMLMLIQDLLKM
jgi:hypothetical protein